MIAFKPIKPGKKANELMIINSGTSIFTRLIPNNKLTTLSSRKIKLKNKIKRFLCANEYKNKYVIMAIEKIMLNKL